MAHPLAVTALHAAHPRGDGAESDGGGIKGDFRNRIVDHDLIGIPGFDAGTAEIEGSKAVGHFPAAQFRSRGVEKRYRSVVFRAFFEVAEGEEQVSYLTFTNANGQVTSISSLNADKVSGKAYNLKGQRVETMKKGNLYIIDGKKKLAK